MTVSFRSFLRTEGESKFEGIRSRLARIRTPARAQRGREAVSAEKLRIKYSLGRFTGINRQVELYIVDGNNENQFRLGVNEHGALLKVVSELDRDKYKVDDTALHFVIVAARDMGTPSRTGTTTVAVVIHDVNDSPPSFEREAYYQFISESAPIGTIVETVKATDPDTAANTRMRYRFAGNDPTRK